MLLMRFLKAWENPVKPPCHLYHYYKVMVAVTKKAGKSRIKVLFSAKGCCSWDHISFFRINFQSNFSKSFWVSTSGHSSIVVIIWHKRKTECMLKALRIWTLRLKYRTQNSWTQDLWTVGFYVCILTSCGKQTQRVVFRTIFILKSYFLIVCFLYKDI